MARGLGVVAIVVSAVAAAGSPGHAQVQSDYRSLVQLYASGSDTPVSALSTWLKGDVTGAIKAAGATLGVPELIAAAILHTDVANAIVDRRSSDATFHIEQAEGLLGAALRRPAGLRSGAGERDEQANRVARRWYSFVASMYLSAGLTRQASWYVREGTLRFPREPMLYFVGGTIPERMIQFGWDRDLRRDLPEDSSQRARIELLLKAAVDQYQRALNIDRHLALAHLHIGWIRLYLHDNTARQELEAAVADAANDATRYLAHLYLGGLAERNGRLDEAKREYEAALAADAAHQTGYVALSRIEEALGNSTRAQELAATCVQLQKKDDDPWWDYRISFDRGALNVLRAEARRR